MFYSLNSTANKVVNRNQIAAQFCVRCAYNTKPLHNLVRLQRRYVGSAFGLKYFKNVGFSVAGNPALSISSNSYAGAFVSGAFVRHPDKNRCGAFFVVCH